MKKRLASRGGWYRRAIKVLSAKGSDYKGKYTYGHSDLADPLETWMCLTMTTEGACCTITTEMLALHEGLVLTGAMA